MSLREQENDDVLDYRAREEAPEPFPTAEENDALKRRRKERADRSEAWRTEAGVYKNWRPAELGGRELEEALVGAGTLPHLQARDRGRPLPEVRSLVL